MGFFTWNNEGKNRVEKPTLFEICTEFNPGLMMIDDEILLKAVTKSLSGLGQMDTTDSSKLLQAHTHTPLK